MAESKAIQSGILGISLCKAAANQLTKMGDRLPLVGRIRDRGEATVAEIVRIGVAIVDGPLCPIDIQGPGAK